MTDLKLSIRTYIHALALDFALYFFPFLLVLALVSAITTGFWAPQSPDFAQASLSPT